MAAAPGRISGSAAGTLSGLPRGAATVEPEDVGIDRGAIVQAIVDRGIIHYEQLFGSVIGCSAIARQPADPFGVVHAAPVGQIQDTLQLVRRHHRLPGRGERARPG